MNAPELTGFAGGAPTVSSTLDEYVIGDRWINVSSEGGSDRRAWVVSSARVDINVFAERRTQAHDLAQIAMAVLFREMGQPSADYNLRTLKCVIELGPVRADDKLTDASRYVFALRYTYVPYQGA